MVLESNAIASLLRFHRVVEVSVNSVIEDFSSFRLTRRVGARRLRLILRTCLMCRDGQ